MIKEYQINVASETKNGADLATGFILSIFATSKEGTSYRVVVQTCKAVGDPPIMDHQKDLNADGVQVYVYAPATDNSKSEDLMLTNKFEADLDTWFGSGNWAVV